MNPYAQNYYVQNQAGAYGGFNSHPTAQNINYGYPYQINNNNLAQQNLIYNQPINKNTQIHHINQIPQVNYQNYQIPQNQNRQIPQVPQNHQINQINQINPGSNKSLPYPDSHKSQISQNSQKSQQPSTLPQQPKIQRKSTIRTSRNKSPPKLSQSGKLVDNNNNEFLFDEEGEQRKSNIAKSSIAIANDGSALKRTLTTEKSTNPKNYFRAHCEGSQAGRNQNGQIKTNQDNYLVKTKIANVPGFNIFGVLDGHGTHGHFCSAFSRDEIIKEITKYTENLKNNGLNNAEAIYQQLKKENFSTIIQIYKNVDQEMTRQKKFDYALSGTTCDLVFQFGIHLVCASVGDSRGILIYDKNGNLSTSNVYNLSYDHKPDLPEEYKRISAMGGTVHKLTDQNGNVIGGPLRVWKGKLNYPGLAMSRSLGDMQGKTCGVIPIPQIVEYELNDTSRYMVICSDGVWEFISNDQVKNIGNPFFVKEDIAGHCQSLILSAMKMWENQDIIRDDITAVVVYF